LFENILNADVGLKRKEDLKQIKQQVLGKAEPSDDVKSFSNTIASLVCDFVEKENLKAIGNEIDKAKQTQLESDIMIRDEMMKNLRSNYTKILDKAIDEVTKSSSDDAYKVLMVLGRIKTEFESIR
jgi:hypothetical protein